MFKNIKKVMKYLVVLFKNKEKKRIIKKFKTYDRAISFFNQKINNNIVFDKRVENGRPCSFELGLLEKDSKYFELYFVKDELGRNIKVDLDDPDYKLLSISNHKVEELLFDISKNKKISFEYFMKTYLPKGSIKLVSKLNHKIVVQDDDKFNLFSLKCDDDCLRFLNILEFYLNERGRIDCIIVSDSSKEQKKYLYDILQSKGISKSMLYKRSTTYYRH